MMMKTWTMMIWTTTLMTMNSTMISSWLTS